MDDRLFEKVQAFDAQLPLARAKTIPSCWYHDPEIAQAEQRYVFGNTWQLVGRSEQVSTPGSFITTEIAGEPILVVRDDTGELRAFHNVCRHRAARVVCQIQGAATKLRCRYHGWTYDLAGQLRGVPEFDGVQDFRREENGLREMQVAVWEPFVLVHWGVNPIPCNEYLRPIPERMFSLGLDRLCYAERYEYELACNWKVFIDNYLDGGYHVNTIHEGLASVLDYAEYHTELFACTSLQSSPIKSPGHMEDRSAASVRQGDRAYYWWVYPNLMLNIYEGVMDTNLVLPLGPNRCRVLFDFYFAAGTDPARIAESIRVADRIQQEDVAICEEVQRGLVSSSYDTGRFSVRREAGGYHFHQLLAQSLREGAHRPRHQCHG